MRVAHGVVYQEVGKGVANRCLGPRRIQALKHHWILAIDDVLRRHAGQYGLAGNAHVQAGDVALRIKPGGHFALGNRVVFTVQHVFFTRPDQLDGCARHLLGDSHSLAHIVGHAAPAKAAAQMQLVDIALRRCQASGFCAGSQCRLAVLRGAPDLAAGRRPLGCGIHGFHGGVVLVRVGIHRFNFASACCNGCPGVAVFIACHGLWCAQPGL